MTTVQTAKTHFRKNVANIIKKLDHNEIKRQSEAVFHKLLLLPEYKLSKRISVYLSLPNEIDTLPILKDILNKNKEAFIPCYSGKKMEMVRLHSIEEYNNLPLTAWNIKQPNMKEVKEKGLIASGLDLILLPGVAFTMQGKRLGHGMGYYDRYLESVAIYEKRMPHLIGLAFNEQIYKEIPMTANDFVIDMVLTENN